MHFGGARGSQDRPGYPRGRSCARPAPTPRQRPRPSGPSGKHPPHRGGGKSRLSYPEARSLELDGSRRGPFCRARALLQGVKRARCPCPGAGGRRRCRTHADALLTAARRSTCRATLLLPPTGVPSDPTADCHAALRRGLCAVRPTLADALPVLLPAAARSVSPASTRSKPEPARRASLAAANRPLLRCSAASQPRRPAPRRLPWRRLCDCVCVLCVGQRGQCGRRGHAGRPLNQSSAGNVVVQSPPSAGSRRCCIPRARACRAPLEASRRAR